METLWKDLKFAARILCGQPGFTAVAVATLALGIGANTALFSVVNAILLRPLPFREPDRLVLLHETSKGSEIMSVSYPNFLDWRQQAGVFENIAAHRFENLNLTGTDEPVRLLAAEVSASLFPTLGVEPSAGRFFREDEDRSGAEPVVVLSHALWLHRFGARYDVIGQPISLDGESHTVIGITPPGFLYPQNYQDIDVYVAIGRTSAVWVSERDMHPGMQVTARLDSGVSLDQARAEMTTIARRLEQAYPEDNTGQGARVDRLHEVQVRDVRPALLILLAAVAVVLAVACANVANLLLARSSARSQELAVRTALGAGRGRLVRQLLSESVLLSLLGGTFGLALAFWGVRALPLIISDRVHPMYRQIDVDSTVLGWTALLSLLTGLLFGLGPPLALRKHDLSLALRDGGRVSSSGPGRRRFRSVLVIAELALSVVLAAAAGLVARSFVNITEENPGFNPENVLTLEVSLPETKYPEKEQKVAFFRSLRKRIEALPGTRSVGLSLPLLGGWSSGFAVEGRPPPAPGEHNMTDMQSITPGYFRTMEIPLIAGRYFTEQDLEDGAPVAVIDQTFAETYWPGQDPLGKRLKLGISSDPDFPWLEVVGVVGHVKSYGVDADSNVELYLPYPEFPFYLMAVLVKTSTDADVLASEIRREVLSLDPQQPIYNIRTLDEVLADRLTARRLLMVLITVFAVLTLLLASVGIYGLMSHSVTRRTHEIGLRMAMGAEPRDVLAHVLRHGMCLASIGVGLGLLLTVFVTPLIKSQLFGVAAHDPLTLITTSLILTGVALAACLLPARRAVRVAPVVALRYE